MMGEPRYVPRPHKRMGIRLPVHMLRRFFNYLGDGRCAGIEIVNRGEHYHVVSISFDTAVGAHTFYRALHDIYEAHLCDAPHSDHKGP